MLYSLECRVCRSPLLLADSHIIRKLIKYLTDERSVTLEQHVCSESVVLFHQFLPLHPRILIFPLNVNFLM
jgi:hypothetical protein